MNNALQELLVYRDQIAAGDPNIEDLLDRVIREMRRLLELERQVEAAQRDYR